MKHTTKAFPELPSSRKIRRDCSKELYRALKRMNTFVPSHKIEQAEQYYAHMVATNYIHIQELRNQRKKQIEWWELNCSEKLAQLLEVDHSSFIHAFKKAYLGNS